MSAALIRADLERLSEEDAELAAQQEVLSARRAEIDRKVSELRIALAVLSRYEGTPTDDVSAVDRAISPTSTVALQSWHPYYGLSVVDLMAASLRRVGRPMSASEIMNNLISEGITFAAKDPSGSIGAALRDAEKKGAVVRCPNKTWGLPEWAAAASSRDAPSDHGAKIKAGLELARQRGVKIGSKPKITPEHEAMIIAELANGTHKREIARRAGITYVHLMRLLKRLQPAAVDDTDIP